MSKRQPSPDACDVRSTKERLIVTAERLFAERGLHGVSLRQIGAEVGASPAAVQYHFGTKEALVEAILLYRLPRLSERRMLLAAMATPDDLRAVVEAHLLPVLEWSELPESYYLSFVEHVVWITTGPDPFTGLPAPYREPRDRFIELAGSLMREVPEPLRTERIVEATFMCLHMSAQRERARRSGIPVMPLALQVAYLIDCVMGMLQAPISAQASALLEAVLEGSGEGLG
jgi:AcrR family transcriptional regulator